MPCEPAVYQTDVAVPLVKYQVGLAQDLAVPSGDGRGGGDHVPAPLEPSPSDPFPDEDVVNLIRPDDAFGATPRWIVLDQEPVSRFQAGDGR